MYTFIQFHWNSWKKYRMYGMFFQFWRSTKNAKCHEKCSILILVFLSSSKLCPPFWRYPYMFIPHFFSFLHIVYVPLAHSIFVAVFLFDNWQYHNSLHYLYCFLIFTITNIVPHFSMTCNFSTFLLHAFWHFTNS